MRFRKASLPMTPTRSRRPLSRVVRIGGAAALVATAGAFLAVGGPLGFAGAADSSPSAVATPAVVSIDVASAEVGPFDRMRIDLGFRLPPAAQPGDKFHVVVPAQLIPLGPGFDVRDGSGATVAIASTSGNTITFTLTNYVASHAGVSGIASFEAGWDRRSLAPGQAVTLSFDADGTRFDDTVKIGSVLPNRSLADFWQGWSDDRVEDATSPANALRWMVASPQVLTSTASTVVFAATAEAGSTIECSRIGVSESRTLNDFSEIVAATAVPDARRTVTCTPQRIDVTVTGVEPGTWVLLNGRSSVTDASRSDYALGAIVAVDGVGSAGRGVAVRSGSTGTGGGRVRADAPGAGGAGSATTAAPAGAANSSASVGAAGTAGAAGTGSSSGGPATEPAKPVVLPETGPGADAPRRSEAISDLPAMTERMLAAGSTPAPASGGVQLRAILVLGAIGALLLLAALRRRRHDEDPAPAAG